MKTVLRGISLRRVLEHKFRALLTVAGIGLGVGAFISVTILAATITDSFSRMVDLIAGRISLQVTGGATGVEEAVLETIRGVPGVRGAVPTIQNYTKTEDGQALLILAVDTLNDQLVRDYTMEDAEGVEISDPLLFLNARNALLLNKEFADRNAIEMDTTIELLTSHGKKPFVVRGLLDPKGTAEAFGGRFALMDVYAAQLYFGKEQRFDSIDVLVEDGADVDVVRDAIFAALGGRYEVQRPAQRTENVENMMASFRQGLEILSVVVIVMGTFIIFNTVYTSVFQRKREIGILRMLGVTRTGIVLLFCLEGTVFGVLGAVLGIAGGYLMGSYAVHNFASRISSIFVMVDTSHAAFTWPKAAIGFAMGAGVAFVASLYPAWRASTFTPLEVVRRGVGTGAGTGAALWRYGAALAASVAALAVGLWLPAIKDDLNGVRMAMTATLVGAVAFTPFFIRYFLALVRLVRLRGATALRHLAIENILRDLGRSAMTVSAFMLGLAVMLEIYIFTTSMKHEIRAWMDEALSGDLVVTSASNLANRSAVPVNTSLAGRIASIPGVSDVVPIRMVFSDYGDNRILVIARDWGRHVPPERFKVVRSFVDDPVGEMCAGRGVILSQNLIIRNPQLENAPTISLDTPNGSVEFPVLAWVYDYTSETGTIAIQQELFRAAFRDELADTFLVFLKPEAGMLDVRKGIYDLLGDDFNLFVLTNREVKDQVLDAIDQLFGLAVAMEVVAMIIAFIGIVNNLMTAVMDRTREIGVLRAVGATRTQVGRIFVTQAGLLGLSGAAVAVGAGLVLGWIHVTRLTKIYGGWVFPMRFSWEHILVTVAAAVAVGLVAGFLPARRAAHLVLHESLKFE